MIDPITAISIATTAFQYLKKGMEIGKDLSDMSSQLSSWAGAMADLDFIAGRTANPPWYKSLSGSAQSEAVEIFAAKEKTLAMRAELKQYIQYAYGQYKWEEFISIEAKVRKQRQEHEHRKQQILDSIINWTLGILLMSSAAALLAFLIWFSWSNKA